jgi:hypothetical protein
MIALVRAKISDYRSIVRVHNHWAGNGRFRSRSSGGYCASTGSFAC